MANNFWIELTESNQQFEAIILEVISKKLDKAFGKAYKIILQKLRNLVHQAISESDVITELRDGEQLRGELGLTSGLARSAATSITEEVANSVELEYKSISFLPTGDAKGGLSLWIQKSDLSNVLKIAQAQVSYYSKRYKKAVKLDWLDWLLTEGDRIIVAKFHFEPKRGRGRSGIGDMKKQGVFRMDSQYAGTEDDNFITRTLQDKKFTDKLTILIEKEIGKQL